MTDAEKIAAVRKSVNEPFHAGTRITNCVSHMGLDFNKRPRSCDLCAADIQNHLAFAIRLNEWLNDQLEEIKKLVRS